MRRIVYSYKQNLPAHIPDTTDDMFIKVLHMLFIKRTFKTRRLLSTWRTAAWCSRTNRHPKSNLLFAKNLSTGLQILFLHHFCEWKHPLQLLEWSLATFVDDIRAFKNALQPRVHGGKRSAGIHCSMMQTLEESSRWEANPGWNWTAQSWPAFFRHLRALLYHNCTRDTTEHKTGLTQYILGSSTWKSLWKSGLGMWWTLKMSFGFSSLPSSTRIMESMRLSTADNWASREITWMQTNLQRWTNRQCRVNQPVLGTKIVNLEYDMQKHSTCGSDLLVVFKRRKWELSKVFHERQLDIHQTLLNMRETYFTAHFTEHCRLSRSARSDLIVLFNTRESCSYLRVAAPVVGITHNGHHLKLM